MNSFPDQHTMTGARHFFALLGERRVHGAAKRAAAVPAACCDAGRLLVAGPSSGGPAPIACLSGVGVQATGAAGTAAVPVKTTRPARKSGAHPTMTITVATTTHSSNELSPRCGDNLTTLATHARDLVMRPYDRSRADARRRDGAGRRVSSGSSGVVMSHSKALITSNTSCAIQARFRLPTVTWRSTLACSR